ncbi:PREDICTED: AT-hook motif nuclear-localized protein 1-like isoform X2 [Nelumbo nucifera]|uniref:AT-hook motif nuclear-localized protein n=1 Tax=Nelumbo nucifera TaxID=4432 RepID=A0A1U8BJV0_NELNU|nr:PREDICTED: AT-hook motif nuclear-localized protein 1-like isoform X2 [Nelumbo nucifera]
MEAREGMSTGIAVMGADAPPNFHVAARTDNPPQVSTSAAVAATQVNVAMAATGMKKKRGRPRKYGPGGTVSLALSPIPISSSAPPVVSNFSAGKRGRGRPVGLINREQPKFEVENLGDWVKCSVGANFTPHVITVAAGEDITMKIISFSQQGPRAICILSANGVISNVTLRQPDSCGGTLTYEGRFEILSLSGSFMPSETGGTRSRSGGMSVSLSSPDGRVVGGGVAGLLVAASPVQVVVGSFLPSTQLEHKPKKQKIEVTSTVTPTTAIPVPNAELQEGYNGQGQQNSATPKPNLASSSSFRADNWSSLQSMPESRNSATDINISLPGG